MAEITKSRLDMLRERNASRYPDEQFADDDAHVGRLSDDYDALEAEHTKTKGELEEANKKNAMIDGLFNKDARSARFMMDWAGGKDPFTQFYIRYGAEGMEMIQDPDKLKELEEQRAAELKAQAEEAEKKANDDAENERKADEMFDALNELEESGEMSKEDIDRALAKFSEMARKYVYGEIRKDELQEMIKMLDHDKTVAEASAAGEVRGKNAKMKETLRKPKPGDGLPDIDGGGNIPTNDREKPNLGALDRFEGEPDIFARGGERRVVRR